RHPSAAIDDPRAVAGSFSMADVRRLNAHVIKLRDMPKEEEPHLDVRQTLQRLPFYRTPPAAADAVIPDLTLEDLAMGTPTSKILAKTKASQKRKASTFGATSSHVVKHTRSALAQSSGSTTRLCLFVDNSDDGSDDDDDGVCVGIPLVTSICSAAVIPSSGNQGGSSAAPAAEGPGTRDSWGKGIMADDAAASSVGVSRPRPSSGPAPSFRDVSEDAIHTDFFPFSAGPYYATYPEGGVAGNCEFTREEWDAPYRPTFRVLTKEVFKDPAVCKTMVDQFPTPREMVWVKSFFDDQLTAKMSVLHFMMMSHGGELLARYLSTLKKQVYGLNDKLSSSDASFAKSKAKGKERKKKIKSLTKSLDNLHAEVSRLSADLNRATGLVWKFPASDEYSRVQGELLSLVASAGFERWLAEASPHVAQTDYVFLNKIFEFVVEPLSIILQLEPKKLVRPTNVPTSRDAYVSPPIAKESTMIPASESLELSSNVVSAPSIVASKQNKEWVNAMVDGPDAEMTDGAAHSKSGGVFVQGTSHVLDDVAEVTVVGSERVSSGLTDVVVALSAGEKGDGSLPYFVVDEVVTTNPSRV
ncbi:hypothetical protein Tco_0881292, partial [Tanacetum coccineum]